MAKTSIYFWDLYFRFGVNVGIFSFGHREKKGLKIG